LRTSLIALGIALAAACPLHAAQAKAATALPTSASQYSTILNRYCVTCHNEKLKTAGLMLDKIDVQNVPQSAPVWEKVVRKLRTGAMPPAGAPRPDQSAYDSLATYLETELDRAAAASPNPGRPAVHRLNRAEYANAIRDLLSLDIDTADLRSLLPGDDSGYGFDNIGDVLSVSPALLERYVSAARKITRVAIGDPAMRPDFTTYDVSRFLNQEDRMGEELPFGSRGGIAIRHFFPADGEYTVRIKLQRDAAGFGIIGLGQQQELEVRLDGSRIRLFTIGAEIKGKSGRDRADRNGQPEQEADDGLVVRLPVKAGSRVLGVTFLYGDKSSKHEGFLEPRLAGTRNDDPAVGTVIVSGPYDTKGAGETPSRRAIFVCHPIESEQRPKGSGSLADNEEACARKILSTLAHRAYRRPVNGADIDALLSLYKTGRSKGDFESGIAMALRRILAGPEFLFRIEQDPANLAPGATYRVSDLELASRLSFFLWSSIPDGQLLELAEHGKLQDPAVLEQQVKRMLADTRSEALVSNFAGQWLYLRNMRSVSPDPDSAPEFDENLREAFQRETELFFGSIVREDRSVLDLLNANYTFVNERLAKHYGIPNVYGSHFRRVTLADENRRGLLGQGSLLTVTSYASRTSPTLRGKWLLANILGTPPPPPPPNVPSLKDRSDDGKILSVRQQMEQHRANPACAVCHKMMDPLGFALENFDSVGKWRSTSGAANTPIDASGVLPDGTKFNGPAELRKVLLSRPDQFVTTVTEKLLTYALGRGVEYYDTPTVRKVMRDAAPDYRWSSLVLGIVKSTPFEMRRSAEATTTAGRR